MRNARNILLFFLRVIELYTHPFFTEIYNMVVHPNVITTIYNSSFSNCVQLCMEYLQRMLAYIRE